jgi:hypothetical protein
MKRILLAAGVASAALVTSGLAAPAALASAPNATCTGTLPPGTYQNVTVPAQTTCGINSSDIITGDVTVATGAELVDNGAPIGGNLATSGALNIEVFSSSVGGNLTVQNGAGFVDVENNTVAGNISVHNNTGGGGLGFNSAGGSCQLFNNNPPIVGIGNTVPPGHQNTCNRSA